ncbi:CSS-motif domain-containing protein [Thermomonas sp.]|uniref:CSS-motif domain-containing protein n=1 Tax=Thermomonas sp. TaxID=1971895 RepID=UPI0024876746|nr:CSS-motif domain-containing protein [Thermomonas sp.]MDI1253100.1 CSS-motif domain-containing protein [Thermomonas sp.]
MRKRIATWVTLAAGLLAILSTISAALYLAHRQSVAEESAAASAMTLELLRRADAMGAEAVDAYRQLDEAHLTDPCSDEGLVLMRDIGMRSNFLQAVGYVRDERLQCSSFGRYGEGLPLGPVTYVSSLGTRVRPSVDLGLGKDRLFLVFELSHYAAAIRASTILDIFTDKPDISLGLFGRASGIPLAVRGIFDPAWTKHLDKGNRVTFFDGHYLVVLQQSPNHSGACLQCPAFQLPA